MNKLIALCLFIFFAQAKAQCPWTFSVTSPSGSYTLPCTGLTLALTASNTNTNSVNYLWTGPAFSSNASNVILTQQGTYTVVATDAVTSCSLMQTFNVYLPTLMNFTLNNTSPHYSITCNNPLVNLNVVSSQTPLSYLWSSPGFTANTSSISIPVSYNFTVTVTNTITTCASSQTFAIGMNTVLPTNSVNPLSQSVSCASPVVTFSGTVVSPANNIQHNWYSPLNPLPGGGPIASQNNSLSVLSGSFSPGIYTLQTVDNTNGCSSQKTFTITSLSAYPTYGVFSPTNFSVGCSPLNTTTITIVNPVSTETPQGICSYTFLAPSFTGAVAPGILGGNTSTAATLPGTWTVIVQDNSNSCRTILPVPITQNTTAPHVLASMFTQTLTCNNPTVLAIGTSSTVNTNVYWVIPLGLWTNTIVIGPPTGPPTSTSSLTYGNYTVIATNSVNACQTKSVVVINQNFRPPVANPIISIGTPSSICNEYPVVLTPSPSIQFGWPPWPMYSVLLWQGPAPQVPTTGQSTYSCYVPGTYTLTLQDSYNGCIGSGTINVTDGRPQFSLYGTAPTSSVSCDGSAVFYPVVPNGYSVSVNTGSLSGNTITNLCYGQLIVCLTYTETGCKKCDSLIINGATSISKNNLDEEFILYPNPTSSSFYIKSSGQKSGAIKVFNVEGKEMESLILESNKEAQISNLKAGIYFVEIRMENSVVRKKVVVLE